MKCNSPRQKSSRVSQLLRVALLGLFAVAPSSMEAQEQTPIWSPKQEANEDGQSIGECFYRKKFTLIRPEQGELFFSAGDEYEIYINGQMVARGQSYGKPFEINVSNSLQPGVNLVAARVRHNGSPQPGLQIRLRIKERGEARWRVLTTDDTWKTRVEEVTDWNKNTYNDMGWLKAQSAAAFQQVNAAPQINSVDSQSVDPTMQPLKSSPASVEFSSASAQVDPLATASTSENSKDTTIANVGSQSTSDQQTFTEPASTNQSADSARFQIDPEFSVNSVLSDEETGSLIAMEINEFGHFLLSKEGGPLLVADISKKMGDSNRVRVYSDQVKSCQGILALNGSVFVTGEGPEGLGIYRLDDKDRDGIADATQRLIGFSGEAGEHGIHGLQLGPDGMIYVVVGNGCQIDRQVAPTSPYKHWYEGDLVERYEDPGGHANGIKAPGGTVYRLTIDGSKVERVAGGIRNAYDLVFDDRGELFIHDSDMEADMGTIWYRPTSVFHVADGAELGWRSGWSKFAKHYIDQTPSICETGRGSPTGATLYQHVQFPVRYQNTIFLADWSEGRILAVRKKPSGAGFVCETEEFLKGRPLNVCDLSVGQDGGIYFCTGGRGTAGGVYQVSWNGTVPEQVLNYDNDLAQIIRHPQPGSAWARQNIATLKSKLGNEWGPSLQGVALEARNPVKFRVRAIQLMVLYGPVPPDNTLSKLASDSEMEIRVQAARLCGLRGNAAAKSILYQLTKDPNAFVRRHACEGCLRVGIEPEFETLAPMLQSLDRFESLAARRLLERMDASQWEDRVIESTDPRVFLQGSLALMTSQPTLERSYRVLAKSSELMDGFMNDVDFVDMLRVMQIALAKGNVDPQKLTGLAARIGNEFPSGSDLINQELAQLMGFLQVGNLEGRIGEYLADQAVPLPTRVHAAMNIRSASEQLTEDEKLAVIECLEMARNAPNVGGSYQLYLRQAVQDVCRNLSPTEIRTILQNGARWPNAVLAAFYKLPIQLDESMVDLLIQMDGAIDDSEDSALQQLRLGVIALLARSGQQRPMEYLRQLWQQEEDRRNDIVIGLSQQPEGENWAYLVSSLPVLDDLTGRQVIQKLTSIGRRPREAKHYRDVIQLGYRLRQNGIEDVVRLLEHWSGVKFDYGQSDWRTKLQSWNTWFQQQWPEEQAIRFETPQSNGKINIDDALGFIESNGLGNQARGQHQFVTAQCAQCHSLGAVGQNVGPDLRSIAKRFSIREILEATIEPSKHIPDRYASSVILTADGQQISGMAKRQSDGGYLVLQSSGQRVRVAAEDIEEIRDSQVSAMPANLLDELSMSQISDLVAFLVQRKDNVAQQGEPSRTQNAVR